jgi:hypothetical protein
MGVVAVGKGRSGTEPFLTKRAATDAILAVAVGYEGVTIGKGRSFS